MSLDKIMAVTIPTAVAAVFLGLFALVTGCQERNQVFRMECVSKGGTVISSGEISHCVMNANPKKD